MGLPSHSSISEVYSISAHVFTSGLGRPGGERHFFSPASEGEFAFQERCILTFLFSCERSSWRAATEQKFACQNIAVCLCHLFFYLFIYLLKHASLFRSLKFYQWKNFFFFFNRSVFRIGWPGNCFYFLQFPTLKISGKYTAGKIVWNSVLGWAAFASASYRASLLRSKTNKQKTTIKQT